MDPRIERVVIVGGGSAGWMTAAYLSKVLEDHIHITVVESAAIPKIGVGEATVPNLQRVFFDRLGLPEDEWMRECNASIKAAVKLVDWRRPSTDNIHEHFYHTFGLTPDCDGVPLSQYWITRYHSGDHTPYDYSCLREPPMLDAKLSPRHLDGSRATYYAWHFDAHLVADYLKRIAIERQGVHHVIDDVEGAIVNERGFIEAIRTKKLGAIPGDLFVDCSGFRGLLINKALEEPFIDMSDYLLCDGAVATAVPHDDEAHGIEPYTSAIAMSNGWTWKIPMLGRFGSGYVYASRFTTEQVAAREFCRLWGLDEDRAPLNRIRFRVGRNRSAWVKNCVSIGLSSCFLEPLESTGLYFIYASIYLLAKNFPDRCFDPVLIANYNAEVEMMFDDCRDFVQAHYIVTPRTDTAFWRANGHELRISDALKEKLARFKAGVPINAVSAAEATYYGNFEFELRNFWTSHSYYCIFAGLGLVPDRALPYLAHVRGGTGRAQRQFDRIKEEQVRLVQDQPSMYEFLRRLHRRDEVMADAV